MYLTDKTQEMSLDLQQLTDQLSAVSQTRFYSRYQTIQAQHEPVKNISIIMEGRASARAVTLEGNEVWIDDLKAGDVFGFEAWLPDTLATHEVTARSDISILSLSISDLTLSSTPEIMTKMIEKFAAKFHIQTQRLIEANSLTSRGRICVELKRSSRPVGIDPGKHIIRPTPIFSEFALRAGSTRETVSRTVSDLVKQGIFVRKTGALVILDMDQFEQQIK